MYVHKPLKVKTESHLFNQSDFIGEKIRCFIVDVLADPVRYFSSIFVIHKYIHMEMRVKFVLKGHLLLSYKGRKYQKHLCTTVEHLVTPVTRYGSYELQV
jgi:hypothetical protein